MIIDQKKIKIWSTIGSRATFGMALLEISKDTKDLMVLSSDVSTSAGLDRFRKMHPEKYVEIGISEQNMIGVAKVCPQKILMLSQLHLHHFKLYVAANK